MYINWSKKMKNDTFTSKYNHKFNHFMRCVQFFYLNINY
ncbi:MAG: hypothetical protein JWP94_3260 [Mucilaginibacter sp.]|jgi:hypothetical protein|nr:hypothetical protein [Mucilaginibacter sp.]